MRNTVAPSISRRGFLRAAGAVGAAAAPRMARSAAPSERPNSLFLLSDDHSAPCLGSYGDKGIRTPNLDRLAAEGMRFDRASTACPQCVPSRASPMTGRSPVAIAMTRFSAPLPAEVPAWPHLLRENGYFTGVCGRYSHLDGPATEGDIVQEVLQRHNLKAFGERFDRFEIRGGRTATPAWVDKFFDAKPAGQPFWKELQQMHAEGKLAREFSRLYFSPTRPMFELYALRNDPFEMNNLTGRPEAREIETRLCNALEVDGLKVSQRLRQDSLSGENNAETRQRTETSHRRSESKIGSNDPCPCGSGKI